MKSFRTPSPLSGLLMASLCATLAIGCDAGGASVDTELLAQVDGNLSASKIVAVAQAVAKASSKSGSATDSKVRPESQKANPMQGLTANVAVQAAPASNPVKIGTGLGAAQPTLVPVPPPCTSNVDILRSLVVTDPIALQRFPLQDVMDQLVTLANVTNTTGTSLFQQWWSAERERTANDPGHFPFCDDNGTTLNGYPIDCPRAESALENFDPSTHFPVALFNRFDMAPLDGSHCGEYRVVYAKHLDPNDGGVGGRNFAIFEAVLPNPNPECGVAGCLPVAEFWAELTDENDPVVRADKLEDFYFTGLPDFDPVIHPANYGMVGSSVGYGSAGGDQPTGQIRTNQFVQFKWTLREFQLERVCLGGGLMDADFEEAEDAEAESSEEAASAEEMPLDAEMAQLMEDEEQGADEEEDSEEETDSDGVKVASKKKVGTPQQAAPKQVNAVPVPVCELVMMPRPVAGSPFIELWQDNHINSTSYQGDFLMQLGLLNPTPDGLLNIGMSVFKEYWAAEGVSQGGFPNTSDYVPSANFGTQIDAELANGGNPNGLTVQNIAERTNAMTCAGCHQASSGADLGNGIQWPFQSPAFVHTDENSNLSTLLTMPGGFLEHRKNVLDDFIVSMCVLGNPCDPNALSVTADGAVVPSNKNIDASAEGNDEAAAAPMQSEKGSMLPTSEQTLGGSSIH